MIILPGQPKLAMLNVTYSCSRPFFKKAHVYLLETTLVTQTWAKITMSVAIVKMTASAEPTP